MTKGQMKVGELDIPDGLILIIPVILVHYDKEIWGEDPKEFKLERFSEGVSKATKEQFSYIPFGGGPRICIGQNIAMMEAEMATAMILQKFSFELSPSYAHAPFAIMTIHPQYGAPLLMHNFKMIFYMTGVVHRSPYIIRNRNYFLMAEFKR
ncbi:hypothetical protein P3S68_004750 [Capsicum galapagoense]